MSILECKGQFSALCRLQRARDNSRMHHGYIFHGPEGVGKAMAAYRWAQILLCSSPVERPVSDYQGFNPDNSLAVETVTDACGECKECQLIKAQSHPDIHIVSRDSARFSSKSRNRQILSLPIDVIREFVIDQASHTPVRGKSKIFIIDEADTMLWQAQNALLKTLEEPPANTYIILVSSKPQKFLQTIRSRCQMVRFNSLPLDFTAEFLVENGISRPEAEYWASFCEGSLGKALQLAQMELYSVKQELCGKIVRLDYSGVVDIAGWICDFAKEFGKKYTDRKPEHSSSDAVRQGQEFVLSVMRWFFHSAMLYGVFGSLDINNDDLPLISAMAEKFPPEVLSEMIGQIDSASSRLAANVNPSLTFESLLIDYCL